MLDQQGEREAARKRHRSIALPPLNSDSTLSEETAHPTVYQYLSQLSVDIRLTELIKFTVDVVVQIQLTKVIFYSLGWISPESTVLIQLLGDFLFTGLEFQLSQQS